jgi:hypothetical protein
MTKRYKQNLGTVQLVPGGMVSVPLPRGKNLLCEGVEVVVNTAVTNTVAWAGGAKLDGAGFALQRVQVLYAGQTRSDEFGWSAWAGSLERQRQYASLTAESTAFGIGTTPGAAIGNQFGQSAFVVDFSTVDGMRPKDSALDLDALGQSTAEVRLTGAAVSDFYASGAGAGSITSQTATVYANMIEERGQRGAVGQPASRGVWSPPSVYKRKSAYRLSLAQAGAIEQRLPTGGLLRGFVARQGVTTISSPVFSAIGNVKLASLPNTFLDLDALQLIIGQNHSLGKRFQPYGIYDVCQDGSGVSALVDCIDTITENTDPRLTVVAGGIANSFVEFVVTDYVSV